MKIVGIGDNVMDEYTNHHKLYPGGNSVNVPVLAMRCGAQAAGYIGVMAGDAPGRHFMQALKTEKVDVARVRVVENFITARNYIHIDDNGDRHFVGNNGTDTAEHTLELLLVPEDFAYLEGFTLAHTSVHSRIDKLYPAVVRRVPISLDFSDGYTEENIKRLCPLLRFAFFSGGEKSEEEVHRLAAFALLHGAQTVVVTRGVRGSYMLEKERSHTQGVTPAVVNDALGAGDAFIAAFLVAYQDSDGDLPMAAQRGADFAAKSCEHQGAFGNAMDI